MKGKASAVVIAGGRRTILFFNPPWQGNECVPAASQTGDCAEFHKGVSRLEHNF